MKLTIQLFATFRNGRFKDRQQEFSAAISLGQLVAALDISEREIGMALVNGRHAATGQELCDGDVVALFPLLGGG